MAALIASAWLPLAPSEVVLWQVVTVVLGIACVGISWQRHIAAPMQQLSESAATNETTDEALLPVQEEARAAREERDRAIAANLGKTRFLANVSHELRTPLQSVLGCASLLEDSHLDSEQRDYLQTLHRSAETLSGLVEDLLDISSMEAGRLILDPVVFDPRTTLDDLVAMLGERAQEKGLALELRVDENLPIAVIGDPLRLRQVLLNLTANAIHFTDAGHVLISAEVLDSTRDATKLRFTVEDTGIGLTSEDMARIREPFSQPDEHTARSGMGAGLGLTICNQLVGLMSGSLDVQSERGQGTAFWVDLPMPQPTDGLSQIRPDDRRLNGGRILVIDSYALSLKITLEMLARHNVDIEACKSGSDAIAVIRQAVEIGAPFDVVIVDSFMPDTTSEALCESIRQEPGCSETRLLILSTTVHRGDARHFKGAGADAFLGKSLRESRLAPMLNRLIEDRERGERRFLTRFSINPLPADHAPPQLRCSDMHVLLVEDNPVNRMLTQRLLEKLGCQVETAEDGDRALARLRTEAFDVVLMDCVMPRMDGFDATRQLRIWEKAHQRHPIPVIALSASAMASDEQQAHVSGMNAFLAKPVSLEKLHRCLENFCPSSQPTQTATS
ncbi:signal transduction histidine kinase [Tamilnaduibacter salinus]|uniref:histidine kinase n=1 Tax=Tamilnaduibacter salinus TaxID=1484056 RepID=A0A2A2I385_9GAMM|nr:response regulator [Tamilnaduibacter salinus]PAV26097.1 hybrid sensor histidine kinase/response regulator [Tamilnaduibacter salinus]PVY70789.1 signal transduction histidine kinase [Tamilnaduibacter salinus]